MRRQTPYVCLCIVALLAACVGARFTYQDLSVPEDGIQGFSITQSFDDNESSVTNWDDEVGQVPSSGMTDASFSVSRMVDSLYDAFFSPHMRTMEYMMPPDAVSMPYPRYASGAGNAWSASYPSNVQIVDSVSPSDLFRQLSLARFAPQRYRVYVVPVAEEPFDGEPTMEDLLRELDEETSFLSSQLDDFTLEEDLQAPDSVFVTHYAADDPMTPSTTDGYDAIPMPEPYDGSLPQPGYDDMLTNSYSGYEYDPLNYEYEPEADVYYSTADVYADSGYDDGYDLALDPAETRRSDAEDLQALYADTVTTALGGDPFADSEPYVGHQLPATPHKRYEVFDELPNTDAGSDRDPMYERGCHGFWSHFKTDGFGVWTAVLCAACVGMWVYVFVEYRCNSWPSRPVYARSSDDGSDSLGSPSESGTKAPLLPLKGEYDGVESADVFLAYSKDYWLKVQHARDHALAGKSDYTLKSFAQP